MTRGAHAGAVAAVSLLALVAGGGCVTELEPPATRLETLRVTLLDPPAEGLGTEANPVAPGEVTFDVEGFDRTGAPWPADVQLGVFLSFGGNKVGRVSACGMGDDEVPLAVVPMRGGASRGVKTRLVKAFGPAALWVEDLEGHAVGASPVINFAGPKIPDLNTPLDPAAPTATYCSPWVGRHVRVNRATGSGALVVTAVFGNAYVVADTGAAWDRAGDTGGYNHLYVFSFGRPPGALVPGRVLDEFSGNFTKFNGFSELGFPLQSASADVGAVPPPVELTAADRPQKQNARLLKLVSATVKVAAKVCPIDTSGEDWIRYSQFAVDLGDGKCDSFSTFIVALPSKGFGGFDPADRVGKTLMVTGMLRNSSGQNEACKDDRVIVDCSKADDCFQASMDTVKYSAGCRSSLERASCVEGTCRRGAFNFWTIQPREPADVAP